MTAEIMLEKGEAMSNYPTVPLKDLVPDRCNFKDKTFESYVTKWMNRMMPAIPMGLLDTESETAFERWQIEPDSIHEAERVTWVRWECSECGEVFAEEQEDAEACCVPLTNTSDSGWAIREENYGNLVGDDTGYVGSWKPWYDHEVELEGTGVYVWLDEGEANEAAEQCDVDYHSEHGHESHGFPWAHAFAFMPDSRISTASLKAAGFRVANYCGGTGNWGEDCEYRLAGIDGGGYSFAGAHFASLVAYHHEERDCNVGTDNGPAYITTETRPDLVVLAEEGTKAMREVS